MNTPARHIRGIVDSLPGGQRPLTDPQQERHDLILAAGRIAMARYGRTRIAMPQFSVGLRLSPAQIRWHFPDLDNLFGAICRDHIKTIVGAITETVPMADEPDRYPAARAAYFAATRGAEGTFTETHNLFLRERYLLPEDEAERVDTEIGRLAQHLGGEHGSYALSLLNNESLTLADIEDAMACVAGAAAPSPPQPAPTPPVIEAASTARQTTQPLQLPRHIRRKIEALRRARQRRDEK
jgi:AcrR family transcriptional regulator